MNELRTSHVSPSFRFAAKHTPLKTLLQLFRLKINDAEKALLENKARSVELTAISRQQTDAWNARIEENIRREMKTFHRLLPQLLKEQPGNFVAISDGKLIGADASEHGLVERMSRENKGRFVLIQEVAAQPLNQTQARF